MHEHVRSRSCWTLFVVGRNQVWIETFLKKEALMKCVFSEAVESNQVHLKTPNCQRFVSDRNFAWGVNIKEFVSWSFAVKVFLGCSTIWELKPSTTVVLSLSDNCRCLYCGRSVQTGLSPNRDSPEENLLETDVLLLSFLFSRHRPNRFRLFLL